MINMTNPLKQPPHIRLNLELCEKLYSIYLSETDGLFQLPHFSERYEGKMHELAKFVVNKREEGMTAKHLEKFVEYIFEQNL